MILMGIALLCFFWLSAPCGQLAEWLKAPDSKSGGLARVSGVRIPRCPPLLGAGLYIWRGGRVAEGARLEIVFALIPQREFESLPLRQNKKPRQRRGFLFCGWSEIRSERAGTRGVLRERDATERLGRVVRRSVSRKRTRALDRISPSPPFQVRYPEYS